MNQFIKGININRRTKKAAEYFYMIKLIAMF